MNLSDLPARELARLDAVCLDFETRVRDALRQTSSPEEASEASAAIDIEPMIQRFGGEHADLLRAELVAIRDEVQTESQVGTSTPSNTTALSTPNLASDFHPPIQLLDSDSTPNAASKQNFELAEMALTEDGLPKLGTEIGPYLLTSVLGRGGMGIVYRATDGRLDRSVAIKMLSVRGKQSNSLIERFQREAKAVAGLSNPHIVELFDVGVFEGLPYAVMEHLRGKTLLEVLRSFRGKSPIPTEKVRHWGLQLAEALSVAHQNGVIHRDIKPENVMVVDHASASKRSAENHASLKLFDFGLSRVSSLVWEDDSSVSESLKPTSAANSMSELIAEETSSKQNLKTDHSGSDTATRAGAILGTPGYMAPEQARGDAITPATDVFALGCVLYEAMFGRQAFEGETAAKRFAAVLEKQPLPDPIRRRDDLELSDLILSMLAKDPVRRPTASAVAESLQGSGSAVRSGLYPSRSDSPSTASDEVVVSRRRLIELGIGACVGGVIGGTFLSMSSGESLSDIHSIGVLSFQSLGSRSSGNENSASIESGTDERMTPEPAGNKPFTRGELLSGLLVNELSRLNNFTVPKYVPMNASQPAEFRAAASLLEVDAIVTGTYTKADTGSQIMTVNLEIISGKTGKLIEAVSVPTAAGDNLIEQSALAHKLAERIGHELTPGNEVEVENPLAFTCLIKGRVRSDPDSIEGLRMAMMCFEHAISVDFNYAQAHAGLALTAITLAALESPPQVGELIAKSQEAIGRALALDSSSSDALLARAMINYQVLNDFDTASGELMELTRQHPNQWQIQHQAGWLSMIRFEEARGLQLLRRATGLHPASYFLKTDLARADWFRGYPDRAVQATRSLLRESPNPASQTFVRGLLIDLYEQKEDYSAAAETDSELAWSFGTAQRRTFKLEKLGSKQFHTDRSEACLTKQFCKSAVKILPLVNQRINSWPD